MTWPFSKSSSGFTLFEALIALSVLSFITGAVLMLRPEPSTELKLQAVATDLIESAGAYRHRAINIGRTTVWEPDAADCDGRSVQITFYPDGTSEAGELCITARDRSMVLEVNALTGRLSQRVP